MSEEKTCFCQNKYFREFLVIATGSFVGVFCAISLFAVLHKPPVMPHAPMMAPGMPPANMQPFDYGRPGPRGEFKRHHRPDGQPAQNHKNIKPEAPTPAPAAK